MTEKFEEKFKEKSERKFIEIQSMDEVPQGMSEAEEAEFWATHSLGEGVEVYPVAEDDPDFPPVRTTESPKISLRMEQDVVKRLKVLARKKQMGYQTLLKSFVIERLYEEEKREGVIR